MDKQLKSRFAQAQKDRETWCGRLNERWREVEDLAATMNVGQEVVVHLKSEDAEPSDLPMVPSTEYLLGFRKLEKGWCVCYGLGPEGYEWWEHPWGWKPIADCSLEQRIEATKGISEFLEAIVRAAEDVTAEVEEALATLSEAITPFKA